MRVLLVYHNPGSEMVQAPPVGLAYVATATREAGHQVHFLDLSHERRPLRQLARALEQHRPEVVGFSVRNIDNVIRQRLEHHLDTQMALIREVRSRTSARVVVGGPAISLLGARGLELLGADFAVIGEGERAFPALLQALQQEISPRGIPGVVWSDGEQAHLEAPQRLPSFGSSHLEQWVDWGRYARRGNTWPIQSKRGCSAQCSYCSYPEIEGARIRARPAAEVVDEIERVKRLVGPATFEIIDSTLNLPASHALELCRELRRRELGVNLSAMGLNPRGCDGELFDELRAAGFSSLMISAESASDPVLRGLRKGFSRQDVVRTARLARDSGIWCCWFFLFGGPGETPETVDETLRFVEEELDHPRFFSIAFTGIRLLPGTSLARDEQDAGRLADDAESSRFYFAPAVEEGWILQRINETIGRRGNLVHSAEGSASPWQLTMERLAYLFGMKPPFWRLYPRYLSLPPVAFLRRHFPEVGAPA